MLLALTGFFPSAARAVSYTWDSNANLGDGATAGDGTWSTTGNYWITGGALGTFANANTSEAVFAGADGTYTITVANTVLSTGSISFLASGYTLTAGATRTFNNVATLSVAAGKTATLGTGITLNRSSNTSLTGGGTLKVGSGATVRTSQNNCWLGITGNTTVELSGVMRSDYRISVQSGTLTVQSGGSITASGSAGLALGSSSSTGALNLDGGTTTVTRLFSGGGSSYVNFNGGTLKAYSTAAADYTGTFLTGLTGAYVKEGGALIDDGGLAITVGQALQHGGTADKDGGLTKSGAGMLTLTGVNTYTGDTVVSTGTLAVGSTGSIDNSASISVSSGAVFDVSGKTGYTVGSSQSLVNSGTVKGGVAVSGTLNAGTTAAPGFFTSGVTVNHGGLLKGVGTISGATVVHGTLAPGNSIGTITTAGLTLGNDGTLSVELGRDGSSHPVSDLVVSTSLVDLSGANLALSTLSGYGNPVGGDVYFLIDNQTDQAIVGTFASLNSVSTDLSEGSTFLWNNMEWEITYLADYGTSSTSGGNDLAIIAVPEPSTWATVVSGLGILVGVNRIRRRISASR